MSNDDHDAHTSAPVADLDPPLAATKRCKHDSEMVNEVNARLLKIKAVADLVMCSRVGDLADDTLGHVGWLLIDLVDETKAIVSETKEMPA